MRALFRNAAVFAAAAILCPEIGLAQQGRAVSVAGNQPRTRSWTARASGDAQMRANPGRKGVAIEHPAGRPVNINLEPPGKLEISVSEGMESQLSTDAAAMLRPTWDSGFWVFPPGGLTRFLIPSRAIINVEVAPVHAAAIEAYPPH